LPRSRALGHMAIMHNGQHGSDAEVDKSHHCQESRQFTGFGGVKHVHRYSHHEQAKACEYPGRSGLTSHRAATPVNVIRGRTGDTRPGLSRRCTLRIAANQAGEWQERRSHARASGSNCGRNANCLTFLWIGTV